MNAYVVLLRKLTTMGPQELYPREMLSILANGDALGSWVALGHFDTMCAYELQPKQRGLFGAINKNAQALASYNDKSGYSHPLYLISDRDDRDFWRDSKPFAAVLRIHFAESVHVHDAFEKVTTDLTKNGLAKDGCQWRVYHTIELSDMILMVKGGSLKQIAAMALSLRRCTAVGKVYTYFGIDTDVVKEPEIIQSTRGLFDERIAWCSVRFAALDFQAAQEKAAQIKKILEGTKTYSIAGVDDIMVTAPEVTVENLINLYHWCFFNSESVDPILTTRLGIPLEEATEALNISDDRSLSESNETLQRICENLCERSWAIYNKANGDVDPCNDWVKPLPKLSNILVRMAHTPVLDEFIYLMLPGVQAFLANVQEHFCDLSAPDRTMCRIFVENWTDLMEHIMRIEGQLSHHPELRPILYDIPVSMLEYTLAFLWQVTDLFEWGDAKKQGDTAFLLVPRLCSRIQAQELYPAQSPSLPGLVLVTIPFQMLYRPEEVQLALTHEASHFVGEENRCRDIRIDCFVGSAAPLIAKEIFGTMAPGVVTVLEKNIRDFFCAVDKNGQPHTMKEIRSELDIYLDKIAMEDDVFAEIMRQVLMKAAEGVDIPWDEMAPWAAQSPTLADWLEDLSTLYREVYADICMLALLPLSGEKYAQSLLSELSPNGFGYAQMAVRLYVCFQATGRLIPYRYIETQNIAFYQILMRINDRNPEENCFPVASIIPLESYAEKCFRRLHEQFEKPDCQEMVKRVQQTFLALSEKEVLYDQLIQDVDDYRMHLLLKLNK